MGKAAWWFLQALLIGWVPYVASYDPLVPRLSLFYVKWNAVKKMNSDVHTISLCRSIVFSSNNVIIFIFDVIWNF